jgi:uncharacterized membrane protein (DUF2068 family)
MVFAGIINAIAVDVIIYAITAIAAIRISPAFGLWCYKKLDSWFR